MKNMDNARRRWRRIGNGTNPNNLNPKVVQFTHVQDSRFVLKYNRCVRDGSGYLTFEGRVVQRDLDWITALSARSLYLSKMPKTGKTRRSRRSR